MMKTLAGLLVDGDPDVILAVLAEFSNENFRKTIQTDGLLKHLQSKGLQAKDLAHDNRIGPCVDELRRQFDSSMRNRLAGGKIIPRQETQDILKWIESPDAEPAVYLLHGRAGVGKSGVLLVSDSKEVNLPGSWA